MRISIMLSISEAVKTVIWSIVVSMDRWFIMSLLRWVTMKNFCIDGCFERVKNTLVIYKIAMKTNGTGSVLNVLRMFGTDFYVMVSTTKNMMLP